MLPNNPDVMYLAVEERQRELRRAMRLVEAGITPYHPIRRLVGRLLVRSGERLAGEAPDVESVSSPPPVIVLDRQRASVDLDRAA